MLEREGPRAECSELSYSALVWMERRAAEELWESVIACVINIFTSLRTFVGNNKDGQNNYDFSGELSS